MSYKNMINCLKFSLMALFLLILQSGQAQPRKKIIKEIGLANFKELDDLIQSNQKLFGNNLVAVLSSDTVLYQRILGDIDVKTIVPMASSSQWLTAAMVLKFVDDGKISLDDKVSQYLPIFETYGKAFITIRHCLSHFTGIQAENKGVFSKKKFGSLQEEVESFAKKEIRSNAGTDFSYNHMGLNIAARILEIVSKKKFDMLIKQQLFNPLGMRKTTFSVLDGSALNPSGGAQSNGEEYMHFLQMLLNKGKYNGQQVLSEASIKELRTIQTRPGQIKVAPITTAGLNYALGSWVLEEGKDGEANVLYNPSLSGIWPMVDWCRGFAFLLITKSAQDEPNKDTIAAMKDAINKKFSTTCK